MTAAGYRHQQCALARTEYEAFEFLLASEITLVALGGAIGAVLRFGVGHVARSLLGTEFPYGTLIVNVVGSFLIAIVVARLSDVEWQSIRLHPLLAIGVLGAFTTFSTFSLETLAMVDAGAPARAAINVVANVVLCLLACWLGMLAARALPVSW